MKRHLISCQKRHGTKNALIITYNVEERRSQSILIPLTRLSITISIDRFSNQLIIHQYPNWKKIGNVMKGNQIFLEGMESLFFTQKWRISLLFQQSFSSFLYLQEKQSERERETRERERGTRNNLYLGIKSTTTTHIDVFLFEFFPYTSNDFHFVEYILFVFHYSFITFFLSRSLLPLTY